jgi:hypothetical protein
MVYDVPDAEGADTKLVPAIEPQPVHPLWITRMMVLPVLEPAYVIFPEMLIEVRADVSVKFCVVVLVAVTTGGVAGLKV